jgi:hypothetical protein
MAGCPLLEAAGIIAGKTEGWDCREDKCAWYDLQFETCAVLEIPRFLCELEVKVLKEEDVEEI